MFSLQMALSPKEGAADLFSDANNPSRKRKRHDDVHVTEFAGDGVRKKWRLWCDSKTQAAAPNVELHLEDEPLPPEWQRCLDIKSGQIHYYNTRTHRRTSRDPRQSSEPPATRPPSLDLDLNLSCESSIAAEEERGEKEVEQERRRGRGPSSWVSLESGCDEMVPAVCMRCHMLVMMCRSSPSCPNCRFAPPQDHAPVQPSLLKPAASRLLSCND